MTLRSIGLALGALGAPVWAFAQDPFEPDNTPQTANAVSGTLITNEHTLGPGFDIDWYTFNLAEPHVLTVRFGPKFDCCPPPHDEYIFNFFSVRLWDDNFNLLQPGEGVSNDVHFSIKPIDLGAGTYFISMESHAPFEEFMYPLHLTLIPITEDRFENNDTQDEATPVVLGESQPLLSIAPVGDEDWFTFGIQGESTLDCVIDAGAPLRSLRLELFDSNGLIQTSQTTILRSLQPGNYWVRAWGTTNLHSSDSIAVPNYSFSVWDIAEPDPYEDDNTPENAKTLGIDGAVQYRNLEPNGDVDWIRIFAKANHSYGLYINHFTNVDVHLFDESGTTALLENVERIDVPEDGAYLLRVSPRESTVGLSTLYSINIGYDAGGLGMIPGTLAGIVTDESGQSVLPNSRVRTLGSFPASVVSNTSGIYVVDSLPQGVYNVEASAQGYLDKLLSISVGAGVTTANIALLQAPPPMPAALTVTPVILDIPASGDLVPVDVSNEGEEAMTYSATVLEGASWLMIASGALGGNAGTIEVECSANPLPDAREGSVVVSAVQTNGEIAADGSPTSILIRQAGKIVEVGDIDADGSFTAVDVQLVINGALGISGNFDTDVNNSGQTDAVDIQIVINAVLGV